MEVKFLKHRTTWAWGDGSWGYKILNRMGDNDCTFEESAEDWVDGTSREYSYSDKFRSIEYSILDIIDVPQVELNKKIESSKSIIDYHTELLKILESVWSC